MTIPKPEKRAPRPPKRIARKVRVRKVKKASRGKMGREADRLFSLIVRSIGFCQARGVRTDHSGPLQCAHIVGRSYRSTRWEEENAFCLCAGCHRFWTSRPIEFRRFVVEMRGLEWFDDVTERALKPWDKDIEGVLARLRARAAELGIE